MKMNAVVFPALVLAAAVSAQAQGQITPPAKPPATASVVAPTPSGGATSFPTKIGLINIRDALMKTAEGQKGALDLEEKFAARKTALQKRSIDLQAKQDQLNRAGSTMSDAAKAALAKDLENDGKTFKRDIEDLNADAQDSESKLMQEIYAKFQPVLQQYAMQNGYAAILDVGSEQSPVLWASNTAFVQDDVVSLYNQNHPPNAAAPKPAGAPATPATPLKPLVPPPTKKQ
jgi:Skp family chaperone for outer membrane proteins